MIRTENRRNSSSKVGKISFLEISCVREPRIGKGNLVSSLRYFLPHIKVVAS